MKIWAGLTLLTLTQLVAQGFKLRPIMMSSVDNTNNEKSLSPLERLSRAASFYSAAIPVFASYKSLDYSLQFKREILNQNISVSAEEELYDRLHEWGSDIITDKINELKGFYVKTGQIISTRVDIFPQQYTSKLAMTQDNLDPLPADIVRDVVRSELLAGGDLADLFDNFDDKPLGSASIAQVHKAKLLDGRVVAVKVQRPGIAPKLLGDIQNLKNFAKLASDSLPIDYYKVFCELEKTLVYELDFMHEAQSTAKVAAAVAHLPNNKPQKPPVKVPLAIPGLVTKHVMVMEFVDGIPLSQVAAKMKERGVKPGSPESILLGTKLLSSLTDAYASMIFGSGIIHGDPHPGNIFILNDGKVALLDCGQVKEIGTPQRLSFAELIIKVNEWEQINRKLGKVNSKHENNNKKVDLPLTEETRKALEYQSQLLTKELAQRVKNFGIQFLPGAGDECAAAVPILLFGSTDTVLPGGYAGEEISLDSPIVQVAEFPSEFILLGRATVMMKGIANRLGIDWSLSDRWAKYAKLTVKATEPKEFMPIWTVAPPIVATPEPGSTVVNKEKIRFKEVIFSFFAWTNLLKEYTTKKFSRFFKKYVPESIQKKLIRFYAILANKIQKFRQRKA